MSLVWGAAPHVRDGSAGAAVDLKKGHVQAAVETVAEMTRSAAVDQRRRFLAACLIVLATFAVRAAYNIMSAYTGFNDPYNPAPACGLCDACQTERFLIFTWMSFTPEFQPIVVALSSPLPLAVSLWLMMSQEERTFLRFPGANDRTYLTPEQKKAAAARARMGVDLPLPCHCCWCCIRRGSKCARCSSSAPLRMAEALGGGRLQGESCNVRCR